jgi:UDP-glucose:(glucosyl)LPS alpha-1,2-glucosyltransferase
MAEIRDGSFVRNETNQNSFGGTERITEEIANCIDAPLLQEFQIVSSRVRDLQDDKIRIFWAHDLPGDPESEFLRQPSNHDKFHMYVFVSNWQMQGYIREYGLKWSKCIVIENAINPIEEHEKPSTNKINFIYTSTPHRGLNILAPVFAKLAESIPNIHLDVFSSFEIYGWGARDEQYKDLFDFIKSHPNMTSHGSQPNSVVREKLKESHIFVHPSIWAETSCLSLIEAMSAKCIAIHSNYGALPETSGKFTTMYQYHEELNEHANILYQVILKTINNYSIHERMTNSAKSYIDMHHSWDWKAIQWTALLNNLLSSVKDRSIQEKFSYKT